LNGEAVAGLMLPAAESNIGALRTPIRLNVPGQLHLGSPPTLLVPGALFKLWLSVPAWTVVEESWSPVQSQSCSWLAMDPLDPDLDPGTDFQAWPQAWLIAVDLPSGP